jgi:hypothetical protein
MGSRIVLTLDALLFIAFGLLYAIIPRSMAATVGIAMNTPGALIDVRGLYGGLELGLGAYLGVCSLRVETRRTGLLAGSLALGGIAVVRLIGIAAAGAPEASVLGLVGLDCLGAVLNVWFYRRQEPR